MRLAVLAHQPRAVHAEHHGERLDRRVVDDVVVGTLQERRIDRDEGTDTARRHPGSKRDGVPLGDTDVEEPLRMLLREDVQSRPAGHRRCDGHDVP